MGTNHALNSHAPCHQPITLCPPLLAGVVRTSCLCFMGGTPVPRRGLQEPCPLFRFQPIRARRVSRRTTTQRGGSFATISRPLRASRRRRALAVILSYSCLRPTPLTPAATIPWGLCSTSKIWGRAATRGTQAATTLGAANTTKAAGHSSSLGRRHPTATSTSWRAASRSRFILDGKREDKTSTTEFKELEIFRIR